MDALPKRSLRGVRIAAFDTSYRMNALLARFTAAKKLDRKMRKLGGKRIVSPETFFVAEREGPLEEGEVERAQAWAAQIKEPTVRSAVSIVASSFGAFAGFGAVEHGIFEIMQGNTRPDGVMINSMGPPCQPEQIWNACEPAMTVIPNYLITGILAILFGLIGIIWSLFFIERKHGGLVLMLLSFAMLLFGGGIFPPVIGIIGGLVGTRINKPRRADTPIRFLAVLWPWTLILFFVLPFWTMDRRRCLERVHDADHGPELASGARPSHFIHPFCVCP